MAEKFGSTISKIKVFIAHFKSSLLLVEASEGQFHITFDKFNHRSLQKICLQTVMDDARKKIDTHYESPHYLFTNYTFTATDEALIRFQMDLRTLVGDYMSEAVDPSTPIRITQASFQIFPVTGHLRLNGEI